VQDHRAVLLAEVLDVLAVQPAGVYIDATFGRGGHAAAILERLDARGRLFAFDRDPDAVAAGRLRFAGDARVRVEHARFGELRAALRAAGVAGPVHGIVLDLGVSSPQFDDPARGFSFLRDGPLDMRMDPVAGESAAAWLAAASEGDIAGVIKRYGEEPRARRVARAIVRARERAPLTRTLELARVVAEALPGPPTGRHPATRVFQALRIHVNAELDELQRCLPQCVDVLAPGGRLAVISFHSLEDRVVKRYLRARSQVAPALVDLPDVPPELRPVLRVIGRGTRPDAAEIAANPRARSAVLRAAERLP
jgi:16S rRNA (cytosine1402-N4)-methyltransferase